MSLSHPSQWLFFAPSPFNAIRTQLCSKEIYHDDNVQFQVASSVHDINSDFGHAISSAANRSSTGSDPGGSGAITSSKSNKKILRSDICTTVVGTDSSTVTMPNLDAQSCSCNIDSTHVNFLEEILTSIENMSKSSLTNLAISHGIKVMLSMSSDHLKHLLSEHLCNGSCLYSTFEGCILVTSTLDDTLLSENKLQFEENNTLSSFYQNSNPK